MNILGLPFPFSVTGDVQRGGPATLELTLGPGFSKEAFDQLRCMVPWWATLGELGALGGSLVAPANGRANLLNGEPEMAPGTATWRFDALAVAPEALVHLANVVYATGVPILGIGLGAPGIAPATPLTADSYPGRWPRASFRP